MAEATSVSLSSTSGFTSFDELCLGEVKGHTFNLVDLHKYKSTWKRIDSLISNIRDTKGSLEEQSDQVIQQFRIGKTYVEAKARKTFNPNKVATWRVKGVSNRWHSDYKQQGYGG